MTDMNKNISDLDQLFGDARKEMGHLPDGLSQRILADAAQVQAEFSAPGPTREKAGRWAQIMSALGGWPAMGGLLTAGAAGIWIGLVPPSFLPDPAQIIFEQATDIDLIDIDGLAVALAEEG